MILFGPDLSELRERAKMAVMQHLVAMAERDAVPPTMRAKYVQKLAEANAFKSNGTVAALLAAEANMRGASIEEHADLIISMSTPSDELEIYRMRTNIDIDAAETEQDILDILDKMQIKLQVDLQPLVPNS